MDFHGAWIGDVVALLDLTLRVGLSVRVIMRRLPVGVSLAWLAIILVFPVVGAMLYLLVGEYRLGPGRGRRTTEYQKTRRGNIEVPGEQVDPETLEGRGTVLARLCEATIDAALLRRNQLHLLSNADAAFPALIADIDQAQHSCFIETYIWSNGGRADEVVAALRRARKRGVDCRVLADSFGSGRFLKSTRAKELRGAGVRVVAALPSGPLRFLFVRPDLRLHRKIIVIDGAIAYAGSMNLADPLLFKQEAGVGHWVDALARVQGPVVTALGEVFREDWFLETGELLDPAKKWDGKSTEGGSLVQVLPTGPGPHVEAIERVVLTAIYSARQEVVLTTPYFIPSESLLNALVSAAAGGVAVTLIVPAKVDSKLVRFASRTFQTDLLKSGVCVALYKGGLLHTKSITVDCTLSLFGSLNLDPRSMRLDLEVTMAIYDEGFTAALRQLQETYLKDSQVLDLASCNARSVLERLAEDTARLVGPIL